MSAGDDIGDRMKGSYENRARYYLPRRTYTIVRVDGQHFHTLTAGFAKPFDERMVNAMRAVSRALSAVQGAAFAFTQSDECSVLLTDFASTKTDAWFDGNLQKICSSAASIATRAFNEALPSLPIGGTFDARVFTIPDRNEVANYFLWRQRDWEKNSVQMLARSLYSHAALEGKGRAEMHDMIHAKGANWANLPTHLKNGSLAVRNEVIDAPKWTFADLAASPLIPVSA